MLSTGRVDLENLGFVPGLTNVNFNPDSSPEHEKVSLVLENTCLAADLLMRLPDETSERLRHDVNGNQILVIFVHICLSLLSNLLSSFLLKSLEPLKPIYWFIVDISF